MKIRINLSFPLIGILLGRTLAALAADSSPETNAPIPATPYDPVKNPILDAETKAMIDAWPKGALTNGLYCALQIIRPTVEKEMQPLCSVNVVNVTTNYYHSLLNLPREACMQIELFDPKGKRVEKTIAGKLFKPWTQEQMEQWLRDRLRTGPRRMYFGIWGMAYEPINTFGIPKLFQLKHPGEYTLHLRMVLADAKWKTPETFDHVQTIWLPEVNAKINIRPTDILLENPASSTNNASPPK